MSNAHMHARSQTALDRARKEAAQLARASVSSSRGARIESIEEVDEDGDAAEGGEKDFGKFLSVMKAARDEAKDLPDDERRERAAALAARAAEWMGMDSPDECDSD